METATGLERSIENNTIRGASASALAAAFKVSGEFKRSVSRRLSMCLTLFHVIAFRLQPESLIKMSDHHRHAQVLEFPDGFFRVLLFVVLFLPGWISTHAPPEDRHAVVV